MYLQYPYKRYHGEQWIDRLKTNLREAISENCKWMQLAQNIVHCRTLLLVDSTQ
jgi:hypothetical protein